MRLSNAEILKLRAKRVAKCSRLPLQTSTSALYIHFALGPDTFAIKQDFVSEVVNHPQILHVPCCPPFVKGIIYHRANIIPVYSLTALLNLSEPHDLHSAIVLTNDNTTLALAVSQILTAKPIDTSGLSDYSDPSTGQKTHYIAGISKNNVIVINAEAILTDKSLIVDESVV